MRLTVRRVATILVLGFALYFVARALWWTTTPAHPRLFLASLVLFLLVMLCTTLRGARSRPRMPLWAAVFGLVAAVVIPMAVNLALDASSLRAPYATWYIGGVGLVGVVCVVRRRAVIGWLVLGALALCTIAWIGLGDALALGLVGSAVWMVVTQLLVTFWRRAVRDTDRLASIQQASSAWQSTQEVRRRARRERVQYALAVAGPSLTRVIETRGDLRADERIEARVAEGRLRDEIRGANLLNQDARASIERARRNGATVTVFDEGGLDGLTDAERERIRSELAEVLQGADSARLIIRAGRDAEVAVTVVGRSAAGESSDEDAVELWREIRRHGEAADAPER